MNEAGQGGKPAAIRTTGEAGDEARTHDPGLVAHPGRCPVVFDRPNSSAFAEYAGRYAHPRSEDADGVHTLKVAAGARGGFFRRPGTGGPPQCLQCVSGHCFAHRDEFVAGSSLRGEAAHRKQVSPASPGRRSAGSRRPRSPEHLPGASGQQIRWLRSFAENAGREPCRPSYFTSATTIAAPMTVSTQGPLHGSTVESWSRPAVVARSDPPRPRA